SNLRVEGSVDVSYSAGDLIGSPVTLSFPTVLGTDRTLEGTLTHVLPKVDPVNQKLRVWAELKNTTSELLPGMAGEMVIHVGAKAGAATLSGSKPEPAGSKSEPAGSETELN
ncbi:MAG: hypothetical protein KDA89_16425, partial [Planctomycetaceae bacterium]|nr:hypothetical protein [Planctomycetaceae bacterium]